MSSDIGSAKELAASDVEIKTCQRRWGHLGNNPVWNPGEGSFRQPIDMSLGFFGQSQKMIVDCSVFFMYIS